MAGGRPEVLWPLFGGLSALDGIGPKTEALLAAAGIEKPRDMLFTLPYAGVDRQRRASIREVVAPAVVTVAVTVGQHQPNAVKGRPYRVTVEDAQTAFQLVFFHARADFLRKQLPTGQRRIVSGKIELFDGMAQMVHPDHILTEDDAADIAAFEPVYPLHGGLSQKVMGRAVQSAVGMAPDLAEWIDLPLRAREGWPGWRDAVVAAHAPTGLADLAPTAPARQRLAYDEVFAHQVTLALARATARRAKGRETRGTGRLQDRVLAALPYQPTGAQRRAVAEIAADLAQPVRMNRLLQGDVGSGKTLVAFLALLVAVEAGGQGVMMAPTEILARQHLQGLQPLAESAGVVLEILTGRDKGSERAAKLKALEAGDIQVLVGTHAVFQKDVVFHDLRLAVVDEQHRFGVAQRMELGAKGEAVDVLVMTATPIPRSLSLAQYGDMDLSVLDEKPPGRTPVQTALVPTTRIDEVVAKLRAAVAEGRQAYWVCPLVEESEVSDMTAAEERFKRLRAAFDEGQVGLVHGQLPPGDKGRGDDPLCRGRDQGAGRHDGDRSGGERAQCLDHGDRAGRKLWPCAIAPAARAGRAGRGAVHLPDAVSGPLGRDGAAPAGDSARDRGWVSHRRGGSGDARGGRCDRHRAIRPAAVSNRRSGTAGEPDGAGSKRRPQADGR
jgi:ATP-dependent DNA helicase RecG